ncbi:MAG: 2,3-bisphosphoglycerate-independent phosphoglycerate mutase [Candidatus Hermodarchaeota archaeon]
MGDLVLKKLENFSGRDGPLVLIIMDGIGLGRKDDSNAFFLANTPFLDKIQRYCIKDKLYTELKAHGTAVGLPTDEEMGNSEVGHNAFGAGKVVKQRAVLAKEAILTKSLFNDAKWLNLVNYVNTNNKALHFIGLLSDGYVHTHISHLIGLLYGSVESFIKNVRIHTLLDGRDVPPQSAILYVEELERELKKINNREGFDYKIASGGGRMRVTMDRYNSDWNVVKRGWEAHVCGIPEKFPGYKGYFLSAQEAINQARIVDPNQSDQYLPSFVVVNENQFPVGKMEDGDVVVYFNFRGDRAIQISRAFEEKNFVEFEKKCNPNLYYYGLLQYDDKLNIPQNYFVDPPKIINTLSDYLSAEGIKQFAIAETHKFGHISYFYKGNRDISIPGEDCVEVKSDPSETIKDHPEMKAYEVKDQLEKAILSGNYKFLRVNFANGDMVGHTGDKNAAIIAAETVDKCVKDIISLVNGLEGITIVTADHGNIDEMDNMKTAHTLNPVMFAIMDSAYYNPFKIGSKYVINENIQEPALGNVAATILNLLGYEKPEEFLDSLIKFI